MNAAVAKRLTPGKARLHVCSLDRIAEVVEASGARSLVTLLNTGTPITRPASIAAERHLLIAVSDVLEATPGHTLPDATHVGALLKFARDWDRAEPLVIHCFAGVSRSTAAAFIAACALDPARSESAIAQALRAASPTATPNARLVAAADALLGREGRMSAAIAAIGRGAECATGAPFEMEVGEPSESGCS